MRNLILKYKNHLISALLLFICIFIYAPSQFSGKVLNASDIVQYNYASKEIKDFYLKDGKKPKWTNSMFSGMPSYQISGIQQENPLRAMVWPRNPRPFDKMFLIGFCGFVLMLSFGVSPWLALIGALALLFSTSNIVIMEAGHHTKALAIAYGLLIIAGMNFLKHKKTILGIAVLLVGSSLNLFVNHVQITYYIGIMIGLWVLFYSVQYFKEQNLKELFKIAGIAFFCATLGLLANSLNLMLSYEYSKDTIRGKSELTITKTNGNATLLEEGKGIEKKKKIHDGLDYDYAFQWSNGWPDIAAMIIPNYAGGGNSTNLGDESVFKGKLQKSAIEKFPFAYWGDLPFTSGPAYIGVIILFLAFLGFLVSKGPLKWWILFVSFLSIILSMGKNEFTWFNNFLFEHLPFYNSFRAPSMALTIAQIALPILAIVGLSKFLNSGDNKKEFENKLKITGISIGSFLIILTFMSSMFTDFSHTIKNDEGITIKDYDQETYDNYKIDKSLIIEARENLISKDGLRGIVLISLLFILLWFHNKGKLKIQFTLGIIGILVLYDLWGVDQRYLANDDFEKSRNKKELLYPNQVDQAILQDKSYYRVLDLQGNPMSNAKTAYFHKAIGGYHAAKLRRYQELWDWHIGASIQEKGIANNPYLDMLNSKYVIYENQQKELTYYINNQAMGNAWFVPSLKMVEDADKAILAMKDLDPSQEAIVEQEHSNVISSDFGYDSSASIILTSYHPEKLTYDYTSGTKGLIVFSEIFYNKGWNAYIDNEPVPHGRANYLLRVMNVPQGKHTITFKFEPATYARGTIIGLSANALVYLILLGCIGLGFRNYRRKTTA